jgi:hypothetical protein
MRSLTKALFLALLNLIFSSEAFSLGFREHGMGDACYFIRQKNSLSLCHPANVAREDDQFFYGNFLFSEGINQSENWKNVIDGDAKPEQVASLLEDHRLSYLTSETNLGLVGKSWAIGFKPYELWVKTRIQNASNPYAQIEAGYAQVVALDFGHYLTEELSVGLKVEAADLKTLNRSFFLTDLLLEDSTVDLKPKHTSNVALSPGVSFEPENSWSQARVSVLWKQSYVENLGSLYSGVSFLNDFKVGSLEWGLGTKLEKAVPAKPQVFTHYQLGVTTFTTSIAAVEQTYGAFVKFKGFDSGLSYFVNSDDRVLLFQMGFNL